MVEEIRGRRDGRGGVRPRGRPALHRRFAPRSSFSSFSGFVGRIRRFARTRSRMTFMYIFTRRSWSFCLEQRNWYFLPAGVVIFSTGGGKTGMALAHYARTPSLEAL